MRHDHYGIDWQGEYVLLRLTRPAKRNAITRAILDGIEACCEGLDAGRARALIVTGEGDRAFSAGTDLEESATMSAEAAHAKTERARTLLLRIHRSSWTSVAALNGLAYGGGLELAMACTFRVAAPGVRVGLPEIKLGVLPCYGGTQLLPALVGRARALDMLLTGRAVGTDEAWRFGLLDRVVADPAALLPEAKALAGAVLAHSQYAIERIRRCVDAAGAVVTDAGMAVEAEAFAELMASEDAREGILAFLEKRSPTFRHR